MRVSIVLIGLLLLPRPAPAADIYRCAGDSGEPAFSQFPCGESATLVQRRRTHARPGEGLRAAERAWLAERERKGKAGQDTRRGAMPRPQRNREDPAKRAYQCERRHQALDAVRAELRRGYRPAKGERLRRRRQAHEAYLSAFCP